jgi:hypothetical protein
MEATEIPSSFQVALLETFLQGNPEARSLPILRRLSSLNHRRAAAHSDELPQRAACAVRAVGQAWLLAEDGGGAGESTREGPAPKGLVHFQAASPAA